MKKKIKIFLIVFVSILLLGAILGTIDYILAKNGYKPIFAFTSYGTRRDDFHVGETEGPYSGNRYISTEYYGLLYKIVVCDSCIKEVYFMPFGLGSYAWFIGDPVDKMNGRWFHAHNNDIYLSMDGVGNYVLSEYDKVTEKGTYILNEEKVTLNPLKNSDVGNCTIKNDYHELYCDKYTDIFMK